MRRLEPLTTATTRVLDVAYYEAGEPDGEPVLLLHGFPYDVHSYVDVIPRLADAGMRVIVPYLRGHGPTRFLDPSAPRSGQQGALGADVVDLMDALRKSVEEVRESKPAGKTRAASKSGSRKRVAARKSA